MSRALGLLSSFFGGSTRTDGPLPISYIFIQIHDLNRRGVVACGDPCGPCSKGPTASSRRPYLARVPLSPKLDPCDECHSLSCDFRIDYAILHPPMPLLSVIIAVYNDWAALNPCLASLADQTAPPDSEVIVIDDGSDQPAPESIRQFSNHFRLTVLRQPHAGISSARNYGIHTSQGSLLLFVDADSRLRPKCLSGLASTVAALPAKNYFQLCLAGNGRGVVGRAEELRLKALQNQLLRPDGSIRYLNTAGFAIRRSKVDFEKGLFDPSAVRAEDTLLLATLIERGELPYYVRDAVIEHDIPLSLLKCFRKDVRSALLEASTYDHIASRGVRIRMTHRERLKMLGVMWKASKDPSIGRSAWVTLTIRQSLQRSTSFFYRLLRKRYDPHKESVSGGAGL